MMRPTHGSRGAALIHAVLFLALLTSTITCLATGTIGRARAVRAHADRAQAYWAAEAAVAVARANTRSDARTANRTRAGTAGRGHWELVEDRSPEGAPVVLAVGRCGDARRTIVLDARTVARLVPR